MKPSRYNYIIEEGDRAIFFNGLTELFFDVPLENRGKYEEILSAPDAYSDAFASFVSKMKSNGFIIDDEIDEDELVEQKYQRLRNESEYRLMVMPTYECNLRCWYCTQKHQNINMSDETMSNVRKLLENVVRKPEIKRIQLSWFGGEPLLSYDTVLLLTAYSKHLCEKHNKSFYCDITTNGTLLNRERIESLRDAGVCFYQITIDGTKETHDAIKVLGKESAFERTLNNINIIAESTACTLRFNYTCDNLQPDEIAADLRARIKKENRPNLTFLIYKVWQEDRDKIDSQKVDILAALSIAEGIKINLPATGLCYADAKNFNCIFPNGRVEKCDNEPPEATRGRLVDGEIIWEGEIPSHIPAFENSLFPCRKCRYLPVCWGPCVSKRDAMLRDRATGQCQYSNPDEEIRFSLINVYKNSKYSRLIQA